RRVALLVVLALEASGCGLFGGGDHKPDDAARAFLDAWLAGDVVRTGQATDNPAAAQAQLQRLKETLRPAAAAFRLGAVQRQGPTGTADFHAKLTVPGLAAPWEYDGSLALVEAGDQWKVHWQPADLYPRLGDGQSIAVRRALPDRAPILDRADRP